NVRLIIDRPRLVMQHDNVILLVSREMLEGARSRSIICYSLAPILSLVILFALPAPKYRNMSRWPRSIFLILAIIGPIWSTFGFLLLFYSEHFTSQSRDYLFQWHSQLTGTAIGLLISLFLSPEFRQVARVLRTGRA